MERVDLAPEAPDGAEGVGYTFTKAKTSYADSSSSTALDLIEDTRVFDSDIHVVDTELGYWIREGLRLRAGYRFQRFESDAPRVTSVASAVRPFDPSTNRHTVTVGVTLTNDLFERPE